MTGIIGLVGLGAMGLPMVKRILASGRDLVIIPQRNHAPAKALAVLGASLASTPEKMALDCEPVMTPRPDVPDLLDVLFGQYGLASGARGDLLYSDMSTITPTSAREFHVRPPECRVDLCYTPAINSTSTRAGDL